MFVYFFFLLLPWNCYFYAVVSFHLTQLVILLLSVLHIREKNIPLWFCKLCKSQTSLNSNLSLKRRIPQLLCRTAVRHRKASLHFELLNSLQGGWQFVWENFSCTAASLQNHSSPTQPHELCLCSATAAHWTHPRLCLLPVETPAVVLGSACAASHPSPSHPLASLCTAPCPALPPCAGATSRSASLNHYLASSQTPS